MTHALLRLARAGDEGPGRLRPEGHRPRPQPGRARARPTAIVIVAENPSRTLYKISEIYDRIAFAGVGKYNEFEMLRIAGVRQADLKGYSFAREDVNARVARQRVRADARPGLHPRDEAVRGRDPRRPGRRRRPDDDELFHILYDGTVMDEQGFTVLGGQADTIAEVARRSATSADIDARRRDQPRRRGARRRRRRRPSRPRSSRSRSSTGPGAPRVPARRGRRARGGARRRQHAGRRVATARPATRAIGTTPAVASSVIATHEQPARSTAAIARRACAHSVGAASVASTSSTSSTSEASSS